jgi:uncharacterized protein with PQ loop repeat
VFKIAYLEFSLICNISVLIFSFRIIHDNGFSPEDYFYYKPLIHSNIITCMMQIIRGMDKLKIEFEDERRLVS